MGKYLVALFCVIAFASACQATRYDLYSVIRVNIYTEDQFNMLYKLDLSSTKDITFWQISHSQHYADIMVAPNVAENFLAFLDYNHFTYNVLIDDVQKVIERGY